MTIVPDKTLNFIALPFVSGNLCKYSNVPTGFVSSTTHKGVNVPTIGSSVVFKIISDCFATSVVIVWLVVVSASTDLLFWLFT